MRVQSLTLAAAGAALLAPTTFPAAAAPPQRRPPVHREGGVSAAPQTYREAGLSVVPQPHREAGLSVVPQAPQQGGVKAGPPVHRERGVSVVPHTHREHGVSAADLLARVRTCHQVSRGRYRPDDGAAADVAVCGTRDAVFWKTDMDVDCDGRPSARCNHRADPFFSSTTAYRQSGGRYLNAATLPYIVIPAPSGIWDHRDQGIRGGSVAAVIYRDRVQYAVVGDTGAKDVIGEASYATARNLGIHPDPQGGGASSGVTYIVFKNTRISPIENHRAAVSTGERLARRFVRQGG
ncbi:glycoside hydrolase family 75 protein [Streptomyces sp. NPDC048297]|uniref:glycoside hydrolase family 75 protein n=1 Tax=Streptomyces sp. NPDC048297 TaxID=3365531 RepID=UPI00371FFE61